MTSRPRLIAGPNGSGKTTLINSIREKLGDKFGIYVNAGDMEKALRDAKTINLTEYGIEAVAAGFDAFYQAHPLYNRAQVSWALIDNLFVLLEPLPAATYFPTLFADFIRETLLSAGASFAFETVMSEPGKVELPKRTREKGYRTYLYFVCIEDPEVNVARVADYVLDKGHNVPKEKILERYIRSLSYLLLAIKQTARAFLYDNSAREHREVAQVPRARSLLLIFHLCRYSWKILC